MNNRTIHLQLLVLGFLAISLSPTSHAQRYEFLVDLHRVENDQLSIQLTSPAIEQDEILFFIPKIVPGIYGTENYGRFISELKAFDQNKTQLDVKKEGQNSWRITDAKNLRTLTYLVDDSWETFQREKTMVKYRSAGSCFNKDERFIINHNCLFGYFDQMDSLPYEVTFLHKPEHHGATSLTRDAYDATSDTFVAANYHDLVDNPVVYGQVDSVVFPVANAQIKIAVFSEDQKKHAEHFRKVLRPLMQAQARYLGGQLPVNEYTFILVWENGPQGSLMGDGLEHSHSTLVLLEGSTLEQATQFIRSICAHEFFHILMPLTIKSEQIANYDFNDPEQSQHLWLYEGMTEYATIHMPMVEGLVNRHEFLNSIQFKIEQSQNFDNDVSLTKLSKNAMSMQDQYYNFYLKGTLSCLCLDIELRKQTDGRIGTQQLLSMLSQKFGKHRAFKDDELFDVIAELTVPEIRVWFSRFIEGIEPLPLKSTFASVGIEFDSSSQEITWMESPTTEQQKLRSHWLGKFDPMTEPESFDAAQVFESLKPLVGTWTGKSDGGHQYRVVYSLSAKDSVLVEHWFMPSGNDSMTLYHLDGEQLLATHYCPQGNQPRLKLVGQRSDGTLEFEFKSGTNLNADSARQQKFQIRFNGSDRLWRNEDYLLQGKIDSDAADYLRVPNTDQPNVDNPNSNPAKSRNAK